MCISISIYCNIFITFYCVIRCEINVLFLIFCIFWCQLHAQPKLLSNIYAIRLAAGGWAQHHQTQAVAIFITRSQQSLKFAERKLDTMNKLIIALAIAVLLVEVKGMRYNVSVSIHTNCLKYDQVGLCQIKNCPQLKRKCWSTWPAWERVMTRKMLVSMQW